MPRIGRVIVTRQARGQQLGRRLMERALSSCEEHWPGRPIELGGQAHLVDFYRSFGFEPIGAPYVEDGIPHQWMRRERDSDRRAARTLAACSCSSLLATGASIC